MDPVKNKRAPTPEPIAAGVVPTPVIVPVREENWDGI
jgi:hypothetical protein